MPVNEVKQRALDLKNEAANRRLSQLNLYSALVMQVPGLHFQFSRISLLKLPSIPPIQVKSIYPKIKHLCFCFVIVVVVLLFFIFLLFPGMYGARKTQVQIPAQSLKGLL